MVRFALHRYDEPEEFTAIVFGDPQPYSMEDMDYFTRKILQEVEKNNKTLFGISLGDIVGNSSTERKATKSGNKFRRLSAQM
ncbi:MAG: Metallophosphoesterase [Proteiniphilum acetatigenes]|uniref:Metallophosphoesterase n=1 Tax=Proteiniphilum acetatigenes TaxID=294710 RepID=A0A117M097_9BACT|nr:MAG: Metallophosphoesterase [Proteiniphilum acetatigenes]KUL19903.1 MAG: Metallophosphoesterase [Proteiniphilum sp. 51_7]